VEPVEDRGHALRPHQDVQREGQAGGQRLSLVQLVTGRVCADLVGADQEMPAPEDQTGMARSQRSSATATC
jgi:hypothetical protein